MCCLRVPCACARVAHGEGQKFRVCLLSTMQPFRSVNIRVHHTCHSSPNNSKSQTSFTPANFAAKVKISVPGRASFAVWDLRISGRGFLSARCVGWGIVL
eukprot:2228465-Amphidinium_carterae.1